MILIHQTKKIELQIELFTTEQAKNVLIEENKHRFLNEVLNGLMRK